MRKYLNENVVLSLTAINDSRGRQLTAISNRSVFPRVLVVNADCMQKDSPTGSTLRSLFKYWPGERLFQVYLNEMGREQIRPGTLSQKKHFRFHGY